MVAIIGDRNYGIAGTMRALYSCMTTKRAKQGAEIGAEANAEMWPEYVCNLGALFTTRNATRNAR